MTIPHGGASGYEREEANGHAHREHGGIEPCTRLAGRDRDAFP
jgi:hypothetical protein